MRWNVDRFKVITTMIRGSEGSVAASKASVVRATCGQRMFSAEETRYTGTFIECVGIYWY